MGMKHYLEQQAVLDTIAQRRKLARVRARMEEIANQREQARKANLN